MRHKHTRRTTTNLLAVSQQGDRPRSVLAPMRGNGRRLRRSAASSPADVEKFALRLFEGVAPMLEEEYERRDLDADYVAFVYVRDVFYVQRDDLERVYTAILSDDDAVSVGWGTRAEVVAALRGANMDELATDMEMGRSVTPGRPQCLMMIAGTAMVLDVFMPSTFTAGGEA